ncbi:hypothetical protein KSF_075760 [Reticulibacter mediterranei]|uniref:Uncharacterized protein n=1 Tax=Reticulibacter mediterranei TaxID=2778369 RepID=A0A8J3IRZ2_9CHLR|nr:hypothetical protein [Reticulibacter mediterranei]GHO97528.1 hypothetical protein KSF_075760 [Reticulibacter mediterranei]
MKAILVDPIILLVPPPSAGEQEITQWISHLQRWLREVDTSPFQWYHCAALILKHLPYTHLPNLQTLRLWQRRYHLDIDIHAIIHVFTTFSLQDSRSLKEALEREILAAGSLIEATCNNIVPSQAITREPTPLQGDLAGLLALAAASKSKQIPLACTLAIATAMLPSPTKTLEVFGEASFLSPREELYEQRFGEAFPLLFTPEEMEPLPIIALWKLGETGVRQAIAAQGSKYWSERTLLSFTFGPHFFASIQQHRLETNRIVLTKFIYFAAAIAANAIKDLNCHLHPLYEADPPSPPRIRKRDGAKAWRLELVPKGAGWRLHYWHIPSPNGGTIEFDRILKKHDSEEIE